MSLTWLGGGAGPGMGAGGGADAGGGGGGGGAPPKCYVCGHRHVQGTKCAECGHVGKSDIFRVVDDRFGTGARLVFRTVGPAVNEGDPTAVREVRGLLRVIASLRRHAAAEALDALEDTDDDDEDDDRAGGDAGGGAAGGGAGLPAPPPALTPYQQVCPVA